MNTSKSPSSSLRFLFLGGWTAIKSAVLGSVIAVLFTLTISTINTAWQGELQTLETLETHSFEYLTFTAILLLVAILLSVFPAFIGGIVLAWLLKRNISPESTSRYGRLKLGALVGAFAGIVLTLSILIPSEFTKRTAHGGFGYNPWSALPVYMLYAIEIIVIATIAGMWTDSQLRRYMENAKPNNTD